MESSNNNLSQLHLTKSNPRTMTDEHGAMLADTTAEFGSLDGIVMNVNPAINELIGGNQRTILFKKDPTAKVDIRERFNTPLSDGTVALGYVIVGDQHWPYREVKWDKAKHLKGIQIANENAGDWDAKMLLEQNELLKSLDEGDYYSELGFTDLAELEDGWVEHTEEGPKVDEPKDKTKRFSVDELEQLRQVYESKGGNSDTVSFLAELKVVAGG